MTKADPIMHRIKPLSTQLANQIAAGEVVERPASVLKELLENAIDAGSKNIEIEIMQGGKSLILVKDNGQGINKEDLSLAVSRHATSKISLIDDLNCIHSLGFRGEALASISSISRLSITSKYATADKAWFMDAGSETDFANYQAAIEPAALDVGTLIKVYDLFYNTPARRKFLRADKTEFRYIDEVFKRIALSHFEISFKLSHNNKLLKKLAIVKGNNRLQRVAKLLGENFIEHVYEVNESSQNFEDLGCLHLTGWIADKAYLRHQPDQQYFYINGRYVRDKLLNHALRQAYQDSLPEQQSAAYILYLSIDPAYVDVNVHPSKHEVRFSQARMVHDFIVSSLTQVLSPAIKTDYPVAAQSELQATLFAPINDSQVNDNQSNSYQINKQQKFASSQNYSIHNTQHAVRDQLSGLKALYKKNAIDIDTPLQHLHTEDFAVENTVEVINFKGQILTQLENILLVEDEAQLFLIDCIKVAQLIHLMRLEEQTLKPQNIAVKAKKLLIPQQFTFSFKACEQLLKYQSQLSLLAIEYTPLGPDSLMLRAIPKLPFELDCESMLSSLAELLLTLENNRSQLDILEQDILAKVLKKISQTLLAGQVFDKNKQLSIVNYMWKNKIQSDSFKACIKVLDSTELTNMMSSN